MEKTKTDLMSIVKLGGGISIDAKTENTSYLKDIAKLANSSGAIIYIRNAGSKNTSDLKDIAKLAPGKVIFEV